MKALKGFGVRALGRCLKTMWGWCGVSRAGDNRVQWGLVRQSLGKE